MKASFGETQLWACGAWEATSHFTTEPIFEPYAITGEIPDPIARPLTALLDEVAALRARVAELERERGAASAAEPPPEPIRPRVARANP